MPILNIGLTGDLPIKEMKFYAELLQDKIEQMSEIKEVALRGVQDFEIEVAVDLLKMTALSVSFKDIINAIQRENNTISAGSIEGEGKRRNLRVLGEINSPTDLNNFVVKTQNGIVYLEDIAAVEFKEKEKKFLCSFKRKDSACFRCKEKKWKKSN
jgi:multidrug efflux pump subunit AcrB